jgi:hypothetical protein
MAAWSGHCSMPPVQARLQQALLLAHHEQYISTLKSSVLRVFTRRSMRPGGPFRALRPPSGALLPEALLRSLGDQCRLVVRLQLRRPHLMRLPKPPDLFHNARPDPCKPHPAGSANDGPLSSRPVTVGYADTSAPSSHPCQLSTPLSPAYPQYSTICTASLSAWSVTMRKTSPSASRVVSTHFQ